jgi:hypothetical protein
MSKNALLIYRDVDGLHCECENGELITDANPDYKTFSTPGLLHLDVERRLATAVSATASCRSQATSSHLPKRRTNCLRRSDLPRRKLSNQKTPCSVRRQAWAEAGGQGRVRRSQRQDLEGIQGGLARGPKRDYKKQILCGMVADQGKPVFYSREAV